MAEQAYVIGPGIEAAMRQYADEPKGDEVYLPDGTTSVTPGRDRLYFYSKSSNEVYVAPKADASAPPRIVEAIDVSSNQQKDLKGYIELLEPEHVIVKLYTKFEAARWWSWPAAQAESARANGCTVGGYVWLYAGIHGGAQVESALRTADGAGIDLPILWLDCEQYTDNSDPDATVIRRAVAECDRRGVKAGIYTGEWWWDGRSHPLHGSTEFEHLPLWYAAYGGTPTLDVPDFGGWEMAAAHQYTSRPIDRSIIRSDLAGL